MNGYRFFVAEEGDGIYNAFLRDDFCEDGFYYGHNGEDGYHIDDFDIVYETNSWEDCEEWIRNAYIYSIFIKS